MSGLKILTALIHICLLHQSILASDPFAEWFNDQTAEILDEPLKLQVNGTLPSYLEGCFLLRLGPTLTSKGSRNYMNYIDSFGRVSKWSFQGNNSVHFQSAILRTNLYNSSEEKNDIATHITQEKTEPASMGLFSIEDMDNTDVSAYWFEGEDYFLTFTDFYLSNKVHLNSLRTLGNTQFIDENKGETFSSSHPGEYYDKATKEKVLINWLGKKNPLSGSNLSVYKMGKDLNRRVVGSVDIPFLPYNIHTVTVVGDYAIVVVGPVALDFLKAGANLCISCSIDDRLGSDSTIVHVFSLTSTDPNSSPIASIEVPPERSFFTFHQINAVERIAEKNGHVVVDLDLCVYNSMDGVLGEHVLGNLEDIRTPSTRDSIPYFCDSIRRFELDIQSKSILSTKDFPLRDSKGYSYRVELASPNPEYWNKPYCYVYSPTFHVEGSSRYEDMGILKIDLCASSASSIAEPTTVTVWRERDVYVGEPIFVADPSSLSEEDGGVLLVVARDGLSSQSKLVVLDARSMTKVAEITAPFPLMFEFHGRFFRSSSKI